MKNNRKNSQKYHLFSNDRCSIIIMCTRSVQELEKRKVYKLSIPKLERWANWDPW